MGDHFVLLVDRLLTEATLEAAIESRRNLSKQLPALKTDEIKIDCSSHEKDSRDCSSPMKVVECRICQDEDEDSNMETPCSCCGSLKRGTTLLFGSKTSLGGPVAVFSFPFLVEGHLLREMVFCPFSLNTLPNASVTSVSFQKIALGFFSVKALIAFEASLHKFEYAHRGCVQRWCDEKGDTVCEICHQPFKPGYTAPPPMFQLGNIPMNFRGNWAISRRDLNNPRIIAMVSADRNFLRPDYDEYTASASRSLLCFRSVALRSLNLQNVEDQVTITAFSGHTNTPNTLSQGSSHSVPLLLNYVRRFVVVYT
ncbi:RING/FYVE/PHD zinc finger superfamily protein [Actinidia rufa]|uniref:RING/FYVE/PHD zinc finger superfamily protein n=1 Tax=Actinidia rufa TaxID=165716 RepID=A0A7J0HEC1_9ERIC|nr:RING/FYVE/PHD zinc finger superfamily protein [Actinidia rufa]